MLIAMGARTTGSKMLSSTTAIKEEFVFTPFKVTEVKCRGFECPRPRSGHRIACDDANIYCFGGYNPFLPLASVERENPTWSPNCPLFKELWSFSITSRKWKHHRVTENMPEELASNAMCVYGQHLMIFGGTGEPFGHKCSNDVIVWRTNPGDAKLNILPAAGSKPPGLYGQTILCHDGAFYTIGGTNGFAYNCDIYRLDLRTLVWYPLFVGTGDDTDPPGRYRHEVARVNNKLYIIGGGTGDSAFDLMNIPSFDLDTNKWTMLTAKPDDRDPRLSVNPRPRKCHSAVQIDTPSGVQVFVAGGSDGTQVFEDIWRLDVAKLQWTLMKKSVLPNPLYFHSSTVTSNGCMYIFGGIEPKNEATSRNNILYKVWLCIPKLSEICFEALMHFHPNLDQLDHKTLLNIGIPNYLVKRMHLN